MSLSFPTNPTVGDTYTSGTGTVYTWTGALWSGVSGNLQATNANLASFEGYANVAYEQYSDANVAAYLTSEYVVSIRNSNLMVRSDQAINSSPASWITNSDPNTGLYLTAGDNPSGGQLAEIYLPPDSSSNGGWIQVVNEGGLGLIGSRGYQYITIADSLPQPNVNGGIGFSANSFNWGLDGTTGNLVFPDGTTQPTSAQTYTNASNAAIVTANTAMKSYVNTTASTLSASIAGANAAIVTANTAMKGYVDSQVSGASYVSSQSGRVSTSYNAGQNSTALSMGGTATLISTYGLNLQTGYSMPVKIVPNGVAPGWQFTAANTIVWPDGSVQTTANTGTYSNANVASYLPTYSGNIAAANVTVSGSYYGDGSKLSNVAVALVGNVQGAQSNVTLVAGSYSYTFDNTGNFTLPVGGDIIVPSTGFFYGNGSQMSGVATKTTGSWTLATGTNTVSFSVPAGGKYVMWVDGNIPNGIISWNATVSVSNQNVPAIGTQYGWYYLAGNALVLTSIPNQIVGTSGSISTATVSTTTSNVFTFGITNNSGTSQVVNWGYITL